MNEQTPPGPHRFSAALTDLQAAQKPPGGVPAYTRWVNRRLGRLLAAAAYSWRWTPNFITMLSALASLAALLILVLLDPGPIVGAGTAALLALGYALDSADGQVARLSRQGSKAGEWLDHVVDAVRTPTIHLCVFIALWRHDVGASWLLFVSLAYAVVATGQFMSQILAEQLAPDRARPPDNGGVLRSVMLTPIDMGVLCWIFLLWGFPMAFTIGYASLFTINAVYTAISMRRKYRRLAGLPRLVHLEATR